METSAQKIYNQAKIALGHSLVPVGDDPDVGCAISVTVLLKEKCGINIVETVSTATLLQELNSSLNFDEVFIPKAGDVIISATGTSSYANTPITHGHCGVVGYHGIMSNNSLNGLWQEVYTLDSWKLRYETQGGYRTRFFRAV